MNQPCGCCAGIQIVTPEPEANRPGLSAIAYRMGTQATFFETMVARLSNLYLDVPATDGSGALNRIYPLETLTTRELDDPSIALLDAWATVADVLTFYQERIANEGYLGTATERRSILELAKLIGYKLRPGVSASVFLAFTVSKGFIGTIPAGTRAQSIPGTGQMPQFFETSADLAAREVWNAMKPRLTQPQLITMPTLDSIGLPVGTGADVIDTLYFQGISTNLQPGSALILVLGTAAGQQSLRFVDSVDSQAQDKRTEVTLQEPALTISSSVSTTVSSTIQPFIDDASSEFAGSDLAYEVATLLQTLLGNIREGTTGQEAANAIQAALPDIQAKHDLATRRKFTRLEPWLAQLLSDLKTLIEQLPVFDHPGGSASLGGAAREAIVKREDAVGPALAGLEALLTPLSAPPSMQPPNSLRLGRTVAQMFKGESDIAPRLLGALRPAVARSLYAAWSNIEQPTGPAKVWAARLKVGLFASTFSGQPTLTQSAPDKNGNVTTTVTYKKPPDINCWGLATTSIDSGVQVIALDGAYDRIKAQTWVAIDRPVLDSETLKVTGRKISFHQVVNVQTVSMAIDSYVAKSTQLTLNPSWMADLVSTESGQLEYDLSTPVFLQGTVVYAQTEQLDLAEEPLDADVGGNTIQLDGLYDGIESGRWIIVSGARTDVGDVPGVMASELVMLSGVEQSLNPDLPGDTVHTTLTFPNALAYTYDASTVTIYGNVAKATHGQTVGEVLGDGDGSQSLQKFTLGQSPLTYLPAPTPAGAASTLVVRVNEVEWHEADNLAGLSSRDRDYITQTDDAHKTTVIFGTGDHGARLPTGSSNVKAIYRYGIGSPGNVDAQQISQLASQPLGLKGVINPLRASGGADADSRDQARRNASLAVEALDRLVSVDDYAEFARTYAGIGKASSARLTDGRRFVVHVTIAGANDIPIDPGSDLYRNFVQSLHQNGDPYVPIQVALRKLKLLVISAGVKVLADYKWESVEPNIRAALLDTFGFDQRDLGQSAFLGEVISAIQRVEGVSYVNVTTFDSVAEDVTAAELATLASTLALKNVVEADLAHVDPTETNPTKRIAPAELAIVTPDILDTVILTQITT